MTDEVAINPVFVREGQQPIPRDRLADAGLDPALAAQVVRDEAMLDGNARLNLATFVTTWMEPEAVALAAEAADRNLVDRDEYPRTADVESRCVRILADLWHAPGPADPTGVSTAGSSEACMLAGLTMKRRWAARRRDAGLDTARPNLVMSAGVQVVWEKFANYFEVEARLVPFDPGGTGLTAAQVADAVDDRTIGVVAILGTTHTGAYEPVADIAAVLDRLEDERGIDVPLHVDAASGGMVAPFLQPELVWDFRLDRVRSINTSGHKYGLVYPGVGWILWRDAKQVPGDLVFHVDYLGGDTSTLGLNFSRSGAPVLLQYHVFLRLGRDGFERVQRTCQDVAVRLSSAIGAMDAFDLVTDGTDIPVFAWTRTSGTDRWDLFDLSAQLRQRGWLVPAYHLPAGREDTAVMRVVVRNGFSPDLAELFLADLVDIVTWLEQLEAPLPRHPADGSAFHH